MPIHPETQRALTNDVSPQAVLTELHQKVIHGRDPRALADLLARDATAAIARPVTVGDDKQMWQMQLQDAMQNQAQAQQTLSNIMRVFNDTAKEPHRQHEVGVSTHGRGLRPVVDVSTAPRGV